MKISPFGSNGTRSLFLSLALVPMRVLTEVMIGTSRALRVDHRENATDFNPGREHNDSDIKEAESLSSCFSVINLYREAGENVAGFSEFTSPSDFSMNIRKRKKFRRSGTLQGKSKKLRYSR